MQLEPPWPQALKLVMTLLMRVPLTFPTTLDCHCLHAHVTSLCREWYDVPTLHATSEQYPCTVTPSVGRFT